MPVLFDRIRASGNKRVDLGAQFQYSSRNPREAYMFELATEWVISAISKLEQYRSGGYRMNIPDGWDHFQTLMDEARYHFRYANPNDGDIVVDKGVQLFEICGTVMSQFGLGYGNGVYVMLMDVAKRFVPFLDEDEYAMFDFLEAVFNMTSQDEDTIDSLLRCMTPVAEENLKTYAWALYQSTWNFLAEIIILRT
jgi:hypothetical protein